MKKVISVFLLLMMVGAGIGTSSAAEGLSDLFEKVSPAVVVIQTLEQSTLQGSDGKPVTLSGLGSGVVISDDGLVLTAAHVVQVAHIVQVVFQGGDRVSAKVVSSSVPADVSLLKLEKIPKNMTVAPMADSDKVRVGDNVFVVGAPYGIDNTLTVGYVSGKRKPQNIQDRFLPVELIQTDAAINSGNSGGPMFNMAGEVIGIVSNILTQSGGFEGIGFAVSINTARSLLLDEKSVWTGIETFLVSDKLAAILNVPQEVGVLVLKVADMSPGYHLGLRGGDINILVDGKEIPIGGDIILEINGVKISREQNVFGDIRKILSEHPDLKGIKVKVLRSGNILELQRMD